VIDAQVEPRNNYNGFCIILDNFHYCSSDFVLWGMVQCELEWVKMNASTDLVVLVLWIARAAN
jgi:hypothetical protein